MSRIGRKLITIGKDVKVNASTSDVSIEGPMGKLNLKLPARISVEIKENQIFVKRQSNIASDKALQGLIRALIFNMQKGVTEGYKKELEIIGVGYKAAMQGNNLNLQLGFSHPVVYPVPDGIKITAPKATQLVISGIDKEKVGKVASEIRAVCPPEPYKGKGIRYAGEYVKKKVGKAAQTAGK